MGNKNDIQLDSSHYKKMISTYNIKEKTFYEPWNVEVTILKNKEDNSEAILRQIMSTNHDNFNCMLEKFKKRKQLIHSNLLEILYLGSKNEKLYCSDFFVVYSLIEYSPKNLSQVITQRNGYI